MDQVAEDSAKSSVRYTYSQLSIADASRAIIKTRSGLTTTASISRDGLNPRTDGGPGHISTDGGGRITAPRRSRKRSKLETSGKRHWIRTDELYNVY